MDTIVFILKKYKTEHGGEIKNGSENVIIGDLKNG